jgi:hypothetical protein
MILKKNFFVVAFLLLVSAPACLHAATAFDHSTWDAFLKKYVNEKGDVNYQAVAQDPALLNDYMASLAQVSSSDMKSWPREESLAFWMNAYHTTLIKLVVENYPVTSVQKIPSFWDIAAFHIGKNTHFQEQFSLNDMRMQKLLAVYRDEKIHLALSLGARGGPKLVAEAFTGPKVEGQLFVLTRQFVNDAKYVEVTPGHKKIRLSKIFKWYGKDFKLDFGTPEPLGKFSSIDTAVLSFLAYYLEDEEKVEFLQQAKYKIQYPAFDWSLNDQGLRVS